MKKWKILRLSSVSLLLFLGCSKQVDGVAFELASERSQLLSDVRYSLYFDLTANPGQISGVDTVRFCTTAKRSVVLDYKAMAESIASIEVNGASIESIPKNEHIVIPRKYIRKGENAIAIKFMAQEYSLNRRKDFLYTLLVPDRARTLFPCFDQPDLKARFTLSLKVPKSWTAVSNTEIINTQESPTSTLYSFATTKPLSTYLFSFVAGHFEKHMEKRGNRTITMYHRETDTKKVSQCSDIIGLVFDSMEWMEDYTGISYPFSKYDFVVIPDFQYGGMEHVGATLYNDRRIFLSSNPTTEELMSRASLIAHETAHMWFGDFVTMRWFDDVWTKEVFANWFASRIVRPHFPMVNHALSDMKDLFASAYSVDRTRGSNAIRRPLANLQDAGLVYGNIIYDKAPIVMDKLARLLGERAFRDGLREYLEKYGYSNASWDELIEILGNHTETDLREWSEVWIKQAGMPIYTGRISNGTLLLKEHDPLERGLRWQQELSSKTAEGRYWIPNTDGLGYGWFCPDKESMAYIMNHWEEYNQIERMSLLMTLYENSWHASLDRKTFVEWGSRAIPKESNPLILSSLISYVAMESLRLDESSNSFVGCLRALAMDSFRSHELRLMAFRQLFRCMLSTEDWEELYRIWHGQNPYPSLILSERDYTELSCQLMIAFPKRAAKIAEIQSSRIQNPDRREAFDLMSRAASPERNVRMELFASFLSSAQNRRPESRVLSALALLCHRTRQKEALDYIVPSLDMIEQIQRTGDIFFPASWCKVLLKNQQNDQAVRIVDDWLSSHPNVNHLLVEKILQAENIPMAQISDLW